MAAENKEEAMDVEEEYNLEGGIRIGDIYIPPPPLTALTLDNSGPRLVITHIENEWFKSYAGKQVLGPFHKSFTSIVNSLDSHYPLGLPDLGLEVSDAGGGDPDLGGGKQPALVHGARVEDGRSPVDTRVDHDLPHLALQQQVLVEVVPLNLHD